jgi:uncharacterized membrane protein YdfJ with MMPL/SSD domain
MFGGAGAETLPVMSANERTHMQPSRNIAARAGRWSAHNPRKAIAGWIAFVVLAFVVLAFVVGGKIGTSTLTNDQTGVGDSGKADRIVAGAYPKHHDELVLIQSTTLKAGDPAFRSVVDDVGLNGLLGIPSTGPIEAWIPLFMFVVLFGLSMDCHVFVLTRVRELYDKGMRTEDAVASAIKRTAGVVTSAAVVMVCVFAVFGTLSWMMFKQMGLGLAFAVLLDATLIRGVLLPAAMKLLGDRNWWLPRSLGWMPRLEGEREVQPANA